uniref:Uncharacterized protein n=1 Tax=Romanomermis culicivorax TaxID=13658 RepID=A0A915HX34_ROMCU
MSKVLCQHPQEQRAKGPGTAACRHQDKGRPSERSFNYQFRQQVTSSEKKSDVAEENMAPIVSMT